MKISKLRVKNFRSISDAEIEFSTLTALVGSNGAGKSNFILALDLFFSDKLPRISEEDFFHNDTSEPVEISTTFKDLSKDASHQFRKYLVGDTLTVTMIVRWDDGTPAVKYHGTIPQIPDFTAIRQSPTAGQAKDEYNKIKANWELPNWQKKEAALEILDEIEEKNPEKCMPVHDEGQFFGFTGVGRGYLKTYVNFLLIPAIGDPKSHAAGGKGSALATLLEIVALGKIRETTEFRYFEQGYISVYQTIFSKSAQQPIQSLEDSLNASLKRFARNASVDIDLEAGVPPQIPLPTSRIRVTEDDYQTSIEKVGSGLQRALVIVLLQELATIRKQPVSPHENQGRDSDIVIAIEEPELYQHPIRQRIFESVLRRLSNAGYQVIYTTHSPLLLNIEFFEQIRLIEKTYHPGRSTTVVRCTNDELLRFQLGIPDTDFNPQRIRTNLRTILNPSINEGFFAATIVLVEGQGDRNALLELDSLVEKDETLEELGIAILACAGKGSIPAVHALFASLGKKIYVMWDYDECDQSGKQHPVFAPIQYVKQSTSVIEAGRAMLYKDLEDVLKKCVGDDGQWEHIINHCQSTTPVGKGKGLKNPILMKEFIQESARRNIQFPLLCEILKKIRALAKSA